VGCSAPRSSIHEVDAVLAGGRATATTNSCTGNRDKPLGKVLTISGANWFSRRGRTCRLHAIYEPTVSLYGEGGRNCQVWLGAPSSPGNSRSPARARWSTHPDVPSPVHPWKMRLPFPNPFARHWLCGPLVHRTGAEARGACAGGPVADSISAPREAQCPQRRRAINFGTHKGEGRERRKCSH
jgi:hypothetical protein